MARRITHVRYGGTAMTHESITAYKWQDDGSGSIGQDSKRTPHGVDGEVAQAV